MLKEIRCAGCNKKLAEIENCNRVIIKCPRCKILNAIAKSDHPECRRVSGEENEQQAKNVR